MEKIFGGFVRIVVYVLLAMMAIVVLLSVVDLAWLLVRDLRVGPIAMPAVPQLFEIFGLFLMVLIGLELLESMKVYVTEHVIRVEILLLAALMAVARKIIVLDINQTTPLAIFGLATLVVALSGGYYLIRRERKANGDRA